MNTKLEAAKRRCLKLLRDETNKEVRLQRTVFFCCFFRLHYTKLLSLPTIDFEMQSKNQPINKILFELALKKQFIHGICSFSDRWCDRCTKTQHCMSFAYRKQIKEIDISLIENDLANERFWNGLNSVLQNNSNTFDNPFESDKLSIEELAEIYKSEAGNWLVKNKKVCDEKADLFLLDYGENEHISFADSIEIIQRYSSLILNRIERSLKDKEERSANPDVEDKLNPYRDNVGSAKVAAILTDRSVAAFILLSSEMKENEKEIANFIYQLQEIKARILLIFPNAMQFIRPGFDE